MTRRTAFSSRKMRGDFLGTLGIEVARRFVGEKNRGPVNERARMPKALVFVFGLLLIGVVPVTAMIGKSTHFLDGACSTC